MEGKKITDHQYQYHSQRQIIYKHHIFQVSGQVNPIFDKCQIVSVHRHLTIGITLYFGAVR